MTGYRGTTISNSSFNTTNMEAMDAFSIGYQKAIILAKKLHDVV